jgi:hypothetical protein
LSHNLQISIEPYRKIVIHEVIELGFHDLIDQMINQTRAVGGATIPMLSWCNGLVFQISSFNPNSEEIIKESLKGIVHYSAITFSQKESFEREIIRPTGTVLLVNQGANANFMALAEVLKRTAKHKDVQNAGDKRASSNT